MKLMHCLSRAGEDINVSDINVRQRLSDNKWRDKDAIFKTQYIDGNASPTGGYLAKPFVGAVDS
jgi:hypothetical protein